MQKYFSHTAFLLFSLLFVLIAVASFAAFTETEEICAHAAECLKPASDQKGEMIWEVVSRQILSLFPI